MTIEQKIGQMMMVGFKTSGLAEIMENIKRYNYGNIILFTRNIRSASQVEDMCGELQRTALEYNGYPAFIGIDQEGGSVRRIYEGVTPVPGAMAVAAASEYYCGSAGAIGQMMGEELKNLGINLNLAPVVDINDNPYNPVIAIRSYGDNPQLVSSLAHEYALALASKGVMPCYKHFLGHGSVDVDSHIDLPRLEKSLAEIEKCELAPYYNLDGIDSIMTAHILTTKIDDRFPASISSLILKNLLREKLKFNGLIITDCFEMEGLIRTFSFEEAATFAVNATTDIITVSHTFGRQLAVRNALLNGYNNGVIGIELIEKANERILRMKEKYCKPQKFEVDHLANEKVARDISRASITIASGTPFAICPDDVVVGVTNYVNSIAEDVNVEKLDIANILGEKFGVPFRSIDSKNFNTSEIVNFCKGKRVVLCLADSHLTLVQKVLYNSIVAVSEVMLISLRTPYDTLNQTPPACHICIYEYTKLAVNSLLSVLEGRTARGKLPVKLSNRNGEPTKGYILENVIEYIGQNYAQKLTLDNVAEKFFLTGGHLCKLLKKRLNKNFVDIVTEVRLNEAKKLLGTTNLKVYEIASLVGVSDTNYFVKLFRRVCGVTPIYFRDNFNIND